MCTGSRSSSKPLPPNSFRKRGYAELRDQLDRASISIVLNIAEGCGRRSPADKACFYSMARGSATECDAILDLLGARGLIDDRLRSRARALLVRIVQMLSRLVALTKVLTDLTQCDRCSRAECGWGRRWGRALCSCGCSSLR